MLGIRDVAEEDTLIKSDFDQSIKPYTDNPTERGTLIGICIPTVWSALNAAMDEYGKPDRNTVIQQYVLSKIPQLEARVQSSSELKAALAGKHRVDVSQIEIVRAKVTPIAKSESWEARADEEIGLGRRAPGFIIQSMELNFGGGTHFHLFRMHAVFQLQLS